MSEWIKISDRMPEKTSKAYLVWVSKFINGEDYGHHECGWYTGSYFLEDEEYNNRITHWCELPEQPR